MIDHDRLIELAIGEIGVREVGENSGERIREYQAASWLEPGVWPWCAAFCCWLLREWLSDSTVQKIRATVAPGFNPEKWRCKDASAFGWETWGAKNALLLDRRNRIQPGDFIIFDFNGPKEGGGHIGIVVEVVDDDTFITVEGNTNEAGFREGDGVFKKNRHRAAVRSIVRIC